MNGTGAVKVPWVELVWTPENIKHLGEHGVSTEDATRVIRNPIRSGFSHSSGRPCSIGHAADGRRIMVVYERVDAVSVFPVTAFEV